MWVGMGVVVMCVRVHVSEILFVCAHVHVLGCLRVAAGVAREGRV